MLIIGFLVYWIELYIIRLPEGRTSLLATGLFLFTSIGVFVQNTHSMKSSLQKMFKEFQDFSPFAKFLFRLGGLLSVLILLISLRASLLPPHLIQEFDVLNYHITIPKQHLILHSFKHIAWSSMDLFLLPLDFALSPYWLVTVLPNKFPQFLFLVGLIFICTNLVGHLNGASRLKNGLMVIFAVLGFHGLGIQFGTAMLDIALAYLFLAGLDSYLRGHFYLALIEWTFLFWAKPFFPLLFLTITLILWLFYLLLKKFGFTPQFGYDQIDLPNILDCKKNFKKSFITFFLLSIIIAGPFVIKSLYYAGTPIFPIKPGIVKINSTIDYESEKWKSIDRISTRLMSAKDVYGYGRSIVPFVKHFWLIAVPNKGVNNQFDYPMGLCYLLCLGPFIVLTVQSLKQKIIPILPCFVIIYWSIWWMGMHQSRFLYIPILVMLLLIVTRIKLQTKIFITTIILSLGLTTISVVRAHKGDLAKKSIDVLRKKDLEILEMNRKTGRDSVVELNFADAAYANFPIDVVGDDSFFVLQY